MIFCSAIGGFCWRWSANLLWRTRWECWKYFGLRYQQHRRNLNLYWLRYLFHRRHRHRVLMLSILGRMLILRCALFEDRARRRALRAVTGREFRARMRIFRWRAPARMESLLLAALVKGIWVCFFGIFFFKSVISIFSFQFFLAIFFTKLSYQIYVTKFSYQIYVTEFSTSNFFAKFS